MGLCPGAERPGATRATRLYRLPAGALDGERGVLVGPLPRRAHAAGMQRVEGDRWQVTLAGWMDQKPPLDPGTYEAFVAGLAAGELAEVLRRGQPLDDPVRFRYPASVRHRYERLRRFPEGLLAAGDAVCSFNPIYGQGMTVAALESGGAAPPAQQRRDPIGTNVVPVGGRDRGCALEPGRDRRLGLQCVEGSRSLKVRALNAYVARVHAAAAHEPPAGQPVLPCDEPDRPAGHAGAPVRGGSCPPQPFPAGPYRCIRRFRAS